MSRFVIITTGYVLKGCIKQQRVYGKLAGFQPKFQPGMLKNSLYKHVSSHTSMCSHTSMRDLVTASYKEKKTR